MRGLVLGRMGACASAGSPIPALAPNSVSASTAYPIAERFFGNGDFGDLKTYSSEPSCANGVLSFDALPVLRFSPTADPDVDAGERVEWTPRLGEDNADGIRLWL